MAVPLIGLQAGVGTFSNGSGGNLAAGAVVVRDPAVNSSFTTTVLVGDSAFLGVLIDFISSGNSGLVLLDGIITLDVTGAVTRGQFLKTSTAAGKALGTGTYGQGVFGVALDASAGGQVKVLVFQPEKSPGAIPHDIFVDHDVALAVTDAGGLTVDFEAGQLWVGAAFFSVSSGSVGVTDNDTTFVFVNSSGAVAVNTTGFPTDSVPLATVVASAGDITAVNDQRGYLSAGPGQHAQFHLAASHSDQGATGAELETLTDGSETTLHSHAGGSAGHTIRDDGVDQPARTGLNFIGPVLTVVDDSGGDEQEIAIDQTQISHDSIGGVSSDDHHALSHTLASHTLLDHDVLAGLLDDDHTQYVLHSILTTTGDLFIATAGGVAGRLAIGSANQIIGVFGGLPFWTDQSYISHDSIGGVSPDDHHAQSHTLVSHTALDHDVLTGLLDDDHTIYALLAGRAGGQTLQGGTATGEDLTLRGNSFGINGSIFLGSSSLFELDEATGQLKLPIQGIAGGLVIGDSGHIFESSPGVLRTDRNFLFSTTIFVNTILEFTTNNGVFIDSVRLKDGLVDTIDVQFHDHTGGALGLLIAAQDVNYTPAVAADWDGGADPGNVDDGLDQIVARGSTRARAHRTAAQSCANNAFTLIVYNVEDYDPGADFSTVTGRYTVPIDGIYAVSAVVTLVLTAAGGKTVVASIHLNGAEKTRGSSFETHSAGNYGAIVTDHMNLSAGDLVDIRVFHNDGGARNTAASAISNHFAIHRMS